MARPDPEPATALVSQADPARSKARLRFGLMTKLVGVQIRRAQLAIYDDFMRRAPVQGLTPGQLAILLLIDQNAKLTQQRLCDGIGVDKSTLVVRLHRLAERGLIRRVRSSTDRRENTLELTSRGKTQLKVMLDFVAEHERVMTAKLSDAEREQLMLLLAKIR